jgi:hypothetical protein
LPEAPCSPMQNLLALTRHPAARCQNKPLELQLK